MTITEAHAAEALATAEPDLSGLRAGVLRLLLNLADTRGLPTPERVDLPDYARAGGYRMVALQVDRNNVQGFTRWADVLGLTVREPRDFDLDTARPWRVLTAETHGGPFTGWQLVQVTCYLDLPVQAVAA